MIIHLVKTCSAYNYLDKIQVEDYKSDPRSKANSINVVFLGKSLTIPLANVICIEES